ncbi:peptidoglycan-binding domain-containing protein [Nannocystis pusilla]|uniref:peptidoglycan-binding domain-containing protein n=1 Tax=Nannocystis pusilla TaxID=889268 RepID=UPI003B7FD776
MVSSIHGRFARRGLTALACVGLTVSCVEGEELPAQDDDTGADADPLVADLADAPDPEPAVGDRGEKVARAHAYLKQYGYFPNAALERLPGWKPVLDHEPEDPEVFDEVLEEAVSRFQAAHGLVVDGTLNAETQRLMAAPRCGIPDYYALPRARRDRRNSCPPAPRGARTRSSTASATSPEIWPRRTCAARSRRRSPAGAR